MLGNLRGGRAGTTGGSHEERATWSLGQMGGLVRYYVDAASPQVSVQRAMTHAATSACVDVLASSVSGLPLDVIRESGGRRLPVTPTPQVVARPSAIVERDVWLYQLVESMLTDGNAFGLVTSTTAGGWPTGVELVDPDIVTERKVVAGIVEALVGGERHQRFPHGDLVHVPGKLVRAGSPFGQSPVKRASETIAAALEARRFGSQFFTSGGLPVSVLYSDNPNLDRIGAQVLKDAVVDATRGNREPLVLGTGNELKQLSVNPDDSQFIDLMRFVIEEACRFFRVPPSMVFAATSGQSVTYANVSQADLQYLKHSLETYLVRGEGLLTAFLPRPQIARFNRNAFLRADPETRHKIHDRRLRNKTTSVNEVRTLEDEEPFDGDEFDQPGIPGAPAAPVADEEKPDGPAAD